jgi:hypothetical protein
MNAYMGYSRDAGPEEGACLIFAHTVQEARKTGYPIVSGWWSIEFTDMAAKRLNAPHLFAEADQEKLAAGIPHAIECPKACNRCEHWGYKLNNDGVCENCIDDND